MNSDQVNTMLLALFATSGPLAKVLTAAFGMSNDTVSAVLSILAILTPAATGAIFTYMQRNAGKVAAVASMSPEEQHAALNKVPDAAKVLIAKAVPDVATVVVKDTATNGVAKLAASTLQPDIVTESQNKLDALNGKH